MMCVKKILISAIIMLALDFIYITTILQKFQDQIITVQRVVMQFKPLGAVICYILLILGLYYFILRNKRPVYEAFFFGLVIYGVYDSTNYATLKKWSPSLAIMDTLWGGVLMASTTYLTYLFV